MATFMEDGGTCAKNCTLCKNFTSYQVEYEDELEPEDIGTCSLDIASGVSGEDICTDFQSSKV
jgi:hypothetical protein